MKKRKLISAVIILIGLGIFSYPLIKQAYSSYRQEELKDAFYEVLEENHASVIVTPSQGTETDDTVDSIQLENTSGSALIHVEEADEVIDSQTSSNIKNRLSGQAVIGLIEIEKIDLIYAIVEGTSEKNLGVAVGHMSNTALIGETGNCVIAGHRGGTSGPYFKNLDKLEAGDEIRITDLTGTIYVYHVTESFVVEPTDVWVAEDIKGQKMLTLITCQDSGTKRLIARAVCD